MNCAICGIRKPKRYCPGVHGDICTVCCGTEREQTVDCPLDCEYLREAHRHERVPANDPANTPNRDVEITESFLDEHQALLVLVGAAVFEGAARFGGIVDSDIREALESLIRTYRTLQSGLYYETRTPNPFAAGVFEAVQSRVAELKRAETEARGSTTLRDAEVLGVLVFLQRLEYVHNNGRKRGKAFLDFIGPFHEMAQSGPENTLEPEAPRLIL